MTRLDEFDDVNDGEKWMMKLWNRFVVLRPTIRLVHSRMFSTCRKFLAEHAADVAALRLRNNLVLHLTNMYNFGLLRASELRALIVEYTELTATEPAGPGAAVSMPAEVTPG